MTQKRLKESTVHYTVRMDPATRSELETAATELGFKTLGAYLVAVGLARARDQRDSSALAGFEDRIAASFERMASLLQLVNDGVQVNVAQVDTLARSFYACVPEPPDEALPAALAAAKVRHARFKRAVSEDAQRIE